MLPEIQITHTWMSVLGESVRYYRHRTKVNIHTQFFNFYFIFHLLLHLHPWNPGFHKLCSNCLYTMQVQFSLISTLTAFNQQNDSRLPDTHIIYTLGWDYLWRYYFGFVITPKDEHTLLGNMMWNIFGTCWIIILNVNETF